MGFDWQMTAKPLPAPNEVEITVIGPGFGECIIAHTGSGRWVIVDSCRDPDTHEPVALKYFQSLGIDPGQSVDWVVATHWHADHISGLSETFSSCSAAKFCCAYMLSEQQFSVYIAQSKFAVDGDNAKEFRQILKEVRTRSGVPSFAAGGQVLARRPAINGLPEFRMEVLSPSNIEYQLFLQSIASRVKVKGMPYRALVARDPNHAAIVLSLRWGPECVLLGADLLAHPSSDRGWLAAIAQAGVMGTPPSDLVKIPHHGSEGAHCLDMWHKLASGKPVSAITPYSRGRKAGRPPTATDLERISALSSETILTAPTESGRSRKQSSPISLGLSQHGIVMRTLKAGVGIARFRRTPGRPWEAELFGRAKRIAPRKRGGRRK